MNKPTKFLWAGTLLAIAVFVIAAAPDFANFNTTQFGGSASAVSIKRLAAVTNLTAKAFGGAAGLSVEDPFGIGIIFQVRDSGPTTQFYVDLDGSVNVNHSLNLAYATASTLLQTSAGKDAVSLANGTGVLRDNGSGVFSWDNTVLTSAPLPSWGTNAVAAAAVFPVATNGVYSLTNCAGAVTFTSVSGTDSTHDTWGVLIVDANGSDRAVTIPASWRVADGNRSLTCTNGTVLVISVNCYSTKYTNCTTRSYY